MGSTKTITKSLLTALLRANLLTQSMLGAVSEFCPGNTAENAEYLPFGKVNCDCVGGIYCSLIINLEVSNKVRC